MVHQLLKSQGRLNGLIY